MDNIYFCSFVYYRSKKTYQLIQQKKNINYVFLFSVHKASCYDYDYERWFLIGFVAYIKKF